MKTLFLFVTFRLITLKSAAKIPVVDILRLNTLTDSKPRFEPTLRIRRAPRYFLSFQRTPFASHLFLSLRGWDFAEREK